MDTSINIGDVCRIDDDLLLHRVYEESDQEGRPRLAQGVGQHQVYGLGGGSPGGGDHVAAARSL